MKMGMFKQFGVVLSLAVLLVLAAGRNADAVNSVTVTSVDATPSQTDLIIPIFIRNDVTIRNILCPLLIRKIGPSYANKVTLKNRERLLTVLNFGSGIVFTNHYDNGTTDTAACKVVDTTQPPSPGGFLGLYTASDTLQHTVHGVPYGILFQNGRLFGADMVAGDDLTGSYQIIVDVNDQVGCFEIDSTCMNPFNHVGFASVQNVLVMPAFAQGVINVGGCDGIPMAEINPASLSPTNPPRGPKAVTFSWEPVENGRAYEFEVDTVDETFTHLWMHRFVQSTDLSVTIPGDPEVEKTVFWRVRPAPTDCGFCFGPWTSPAQYTDVQTIASSDVPDTYILNQNYPNPFNASTVIQFATKRDGQVRLDVYNILGQDVATLVNEFKPVGTYSVTWDGTDSHGNVVPSGMYFYRVSTADFTAVKKMTLLK